MDSSPWSPREAELLAVTLRLLQQQGYERLTLDAVAATARASKSTVYRRWPSKAELVLAAVIHGDAQISVVPETGTLRDDLLLLANTICEHACERACTMRALMVEVTRNAALKEVMQHQILGQCKSMFDHVLWHAVERGELDQAAITDDLWDLIPGYLIFRSIWSARPLTRRTVARLVDDVMLPSLTRRSRRA